MDRQEGGIQLSRRWFLGGAISLAAVSFTQLPSGVGAVARELKSGNKPQIWADGIHDDSHGLGALLRREVVLLPKSGIVIEDHQGCTIHHGEFCIDAEVHVPADADFRIDRARFYGRKLPNDAAFFCISPEMAKRFAGNSQIIWMIDPAKPIILRSHEMWDGERLRALA